MSFSSVNLLWQKRFRGLMPVAQHAVADSGHTLLIRPDEMERRTYQVLSLDPDGNGTELSAISVERVYRFDAVADGRLVLGMTGDDVYVFRDGKKARFMAERRVTYADTALAPEPGWFVCGFSDALFNSHGIAFGDANGRLGWHKDMEIAVERVSITHDGRAIAIGLQDGRVLVLDNMRNPLWTCAQEETITALAMPGSGRSVVAGTGAGSVLSLDDDGGFRWRSSVGLPVIAAAVDRENRWVASLHSDGTSHLLVCFGPDGSPIWEYDLDSKPTGVSLSPDARHLALSTSSGTASGFEVDFAATPSYTIGGRKGRDLAAAAAAEEQGDLRHAHAVLLSLAEAAPWDAEIAQRRLAARAALVDALEAEIEGLADEGKWTEAFDVLQEAAGLDPFSARVFGLRGALRERAVAGLEEKAATLEITYDYEGAARLHAQVLAWDPERADAREALNRIRRAQAKELMEQGDEREHDGDLPGALALWSQAQQLDPNEDLAARVSKAELDRSLAAGIAHYEAGRVAEAMFQFRKALALDPENETAERYLGYTEGQTGDTLIADRFARLE